MATTHRDRFTPTVKEGPSGTPYIVFELAGDAVLPGLEKNSFGIFMEPGTSIETAQEIKRLIHKHNAGFFVTES